MLHTPLLPFDCNGQGAEIYLKLENLQAIGSFKLRGAGNAIAMADTDELKKGVVTASAGNMAQGVAWNARRLNVPCTVIAPDHAPESKLTAIERLGGKVKKIPFADWWTILESGCCDYPGFFIHPVSNPNVIAGNGTIGLEILEDLPDVDSIVIPFGGGGLSSGIASAVRALKPDTKIYACEVETATPLKAALEAGSPQSVEYTASFVDGIGGSSVLTDMWPLVSTLIDESLVVTLEQIAEAIRLLMGRANVVAEGAGAASLAAALNGGAGHGKVVCVISGGNIDAVKLAKILTGVLP